MKWSCRIIFVLLLSNLTEIAESNLLSKFKSSFLSRANSKGSNESYTYRDHQCRSEPGRNRIIVQTGSIIRAQYHRFVDSVKRLWKFISIASGIALANETVSTLHHADIRHDDTLSSDNNATYRNEDIANIMNDFLAVEGLSERSRDAGMAVTDDFIHRYMVASQWTKIYHGKR